MRGDRLQPRQASNLTPPKSKGSAMTGMRTFGRRKLSPTATLFFWLFICASIGIATWLVLMAAVFQPMCTTITSSGSPTQTVCVEYNKP